MNDKKECLRNLDGNNPDKCKGEITNRFTDQETEIWECEHHMTQSLKRNEKVRKNYPDSPIPPKWFDSTYAGERWDEEY